MLHTDLFTGFGKRMTAFLLVLLLAVSTLLSGCTGTSSQNGDQGKKTESGSGLIVVDATDEETASVSETETPLQIETEETVQAETETEVSEANAGLTVEKNGSYTSKEEVALYIHTYNKLPSNYITKKDAEAKGWNSSKGNLWKVCPGKSIGGSYFGNYEGLLPEKKGRKYYECDIDYDGGYRNAKRIIYSNDGLVYYTEDHYESFEQLY